MSDVLALGREGRLPARLTAAKATPERAWLGEVSAVMPRQALAGLDTAYRNIFASVVGRRKGPKAGRARFRSCKDRRQAIRFTASRSVQGADQRGKLRLPKIAGRAGALVVPAAARAVRGHGDQGASPGPPRWR